ncbi:MAG: tetratricopeptide repeat protein, partial [Myxococcota bacterium]|nr:tetratricopeptide repeat protein [Myxococcota bacterium]
SVLGKLQLLAGDTAAAEAAFDLGLRAAAEAGDDELTAVLLMDLAHLLGNSRLQWARAAELVRAANAAVVRAGNPPKLEASFLLSRGLIAEVDGNFEAAEQDYLRALELRREIAGPDDIAIALQALAMATRGLGKFDEARRHGEAAFELVRGALGEDHPIVAEAESNLALTIAVMGNVAGARQRWEAALGRLERGLGEDAPALANVLLNLDTASRSLGDAAAADAYLKRALEVSTGPSNSPDNLDVRIRIANQLVSTGKLAAGIQMLDDLSRRAEAALGNAHGTTAHAYLELGDAYYDSARYAEALTAWGKAVAVTRALYGERHVAVLSLQGRYGQAMLMTGDAKGARAVFEEVVFALEATVNPDTPHLATAYTNLADALIATGDAERAIEPATKALAIREAGAADALQTSEARFVLARALWRARRDPRAVAMARVARDEMRAIGPRATTLPEIQRWLAGTR